MRRTYFNITFILLAIVQMVICNYFQFTPLITLSILPAMILCVPLSINTPICMVIAFATGLSVDWLAEGIIGLNAASLLPVAFARKTIIRLLIGEDLVVREESLSFRKNGFEKISIALLVSYGIFFFLYIILDGAGLRPFWFNLIRFILSILLSMVVGLITAGSLTQDDRK